MPDDLLWIVDYVAGRLLAARVAGPGSAVRALEHIRPFATTRLSLQRGLAP